MIACRESLWVLAHTANHSESWTAFNSFNEKTEKAPFNYQSHVESKTLDSKSSCGLFHYINSRIKNRRSCSSLVDEDSNIIISDKQKALLLRFFKKCIPITAHGHPTLLKV